PEEADAATWAAAKPGPSPRARPSSTLRQCFLDRAVDIGAELFAMVAACGRAEMLREDDPALGRSSYQLAGAICAPSRVAGEDALVEESDWRRARRVTRQRRRH